MKGTRTKRSGAYTCRISSRDPATGKRKMVTFTVHGTAAQADAELRRRIVAMENGADPFPQAMTFRQYADTWLASKVTHGLRDSTTARYRELLALYATPAIGELELRKVKAAHVRAILEAMAARGSVTQARAVLRGLFGSALEGGLIDANPVIAVRVPKRAKPKLSVPDPVQLAALIVAAKGSPYEIPLLLAVTTGARRSEVLGLRWSQTDLAKGHIRITQTLQRGSGPGRPLQFLDPKTERSRRQIALPAFVVERLRAHRRDQAERQLLLGPGWTNLDLVCERGDGTPISPDAFSAAFKKLAAEVGLPQNTRLHDVRHGFATALLGQGVHPAITSAVLGHASPAFTMSVYQHVTPNMGELAATAIGEALGGGR